MEKYKIIALISIITIVSISTISAIGIISINENISKLIERKENLQEKVSGKMQELSDIDTSISGISKELDQAILDLEEMKSEIDKLESGNSYELHDPTYWEAEDFRLKDLTKKTPYDVETFNCINYAQESNNVAENRGIRCALVYLDLVGEVSHSIVAFDTTNSGIIYYEPQNGRRIDNLQIGRDYWADCVPAPPGYYFPNDPDNIIVGIILFW